MKKVFLVDLDNTLLDIDAFKNDCEECFIKTFNQPDGHLLWSVYGQVRKELGFVDLLEISQRLAEELSLQDSCLVRDLFYKAHYKKYLFPQALEFLEYLKTLGKVKVLTLGEEKWQLLKVKKSGIQKIVGKENVHISKKKNEMLVEIIKKLKTDGMEDIVVIDDKAEVMEIACQEGVCGLHIKYGQYKDQPQQNMTSIAFEGRSLADIYDYLHKQHVVGKIGDLKIKRGILPRQVKQLIKFTSQDKEVQKFTSDLKRFMNKRMFDSWLKEKERVIYTLVDKKENLGGLLWFSQKKMPEARYPKNFDENAYQTTFGIRMYGKMRGKGLAKKFMDQVLKNRIEEEKNLKLWGVVSPDNKPGIHLYQAFGFKEKAQDRKRNKTIMIYHNP